METGFSSASAPTSESVGVDTSVNLSTRSFRKKEGANWDVIVNWYHLEMVRNPSARVEHEATASKIGEDQLFYFQQRGIDHEKAVAAMISGFCRDVFNELPLEFAAEVNQLMSLKLEGSIG